MRILVCCLLALLPAGSVLAQPQSAEDWLLRMLRADAQQSFQGSFSYQRGADFSTHAIWHQVLDSAVRERLLRLDGPLQEMLQEDGQLVCATEGMQELLPFAHYSAQALDVQALGSGYALRLGGNARVAGRSAVLLKLMPRDTHRYPLELSIDAQTGLLLKSELFNEQGQVLERLQFLSFAAGVPPAAALAPSRACLPLAAAAASAAGSASNAWHLQWLPPGFRLQQAQAGSAARPGDAACLTYADGLARFSVFLEPLGNEQGEDVRRQLGPTALVSRRLLNASGNLMVTVVGEIPPGTAERIALSIRAGPAPAAP